MIKIAICDDKDEMVGEIETMLLEISKSKKGISMDILLTMARH